MIPSRFKENILKSGGGPKVLRDLATGFTTVPASVREHRQSEEDKTCRSDYVELNNPEEHALSFCYRFAEGQERTDEPKGTSVPSQIRVILYFPFAPSFKSACLGPDDNRS